MVYTLDMKKILIIDDEPLIREGLAKAVRDKEVEVKTVNAGSDALSEISSCFFDLCFLDIRLPDANGLDIMKKIKEISPDTKIIIMTACDIYNEIKDSLAKSAYTYVEKPFDLMHVKEIAKDALTGEIAKPYSNPNFLM